MPLDESGKLGYIFLHKTKILYDILYYVDKNKAGH